MCKYIVQQFGKACKRYKYAFCRGVDNPKCDFSKMHQL
nr:MAG TPA: hypothetical protein [Caudoviricetes sp.]